jgi:ABC-type spermidine/putrescine transport system permease subunit I
VGAALGAVGFIACALFISLTLQRWSTAASLGVGLSIWLALSVVLYALYALLASRGRDDEG